MVRGEILSWSLDLSISFGDNQPIRDTSSHLKREERENENGKRIRKKTNVRITYGASIYSIVLFLFSYNLASVSNGTDFKECKGENKTYCIECIDVNFALRVTKRPSLNIVGIISSHQILFGNNTIGL